MKILPLLVKSIITEVFEVLETELNSDKIRSDVDVLKTPDSSFFLSRPGFDEKKGKRKIIKGEATRARGHVKI